MGSAKAAVKPPKRRESWDQSCWVVAALGLKAQGISRQPETVSGDISLPLRRSPQDACGAVENQVQGRRAILML